MNCKAIQEMLPAYQDRELAPQEMEAVRLHLAGCPSCASELRLLARTWDTLGSLSAIEPSPDFKARFWERVREEEAKPGLWDWIAWPRLVPALAGVMALWVLGMGGGLFLFERHAVSPVAATNAALTIFTSSYPPNSIEQIFLQGGAGMQSRGGHV